MAINFFEQSKDRIIHESNNSLLTDNNPSKIFVENHNNLEQEIQLNYVENKLMIFFDSLKNNQPRKYTFKDFLNLTSLVIRYGSNKFNKGEIEDCIELYKYFISQCKDKLISKLYLIGFNDEVGHDFIKSEIEEAYTIINQYGLVNRKIASKLRSRIDSFFTYDLFLEKKLEFDLMLINNRDKITAVHNELVQSIVNKAKFSVQLLVSKGAYFLAALYARHLTFGLYDYFMRQRIWLNSDQKRISTSIASDLRTLIELHGKLKSGNSYSFVATFCETMSEIDNMMEMNLDFYYDSNNNTYK